jgi:hypothetical protein
MDFVLGSDHNSQDFPSKDSRLFKFFWWRYNYGLTNKVHTHTHTLNRGFEIGKSYKKRCLIKL